MNVIEWSLQCGLNIDDYKDTILSIGDVCAIRKKGGKKFRRDYERGFVILATAMKYKSRRMLEFGTGRGFGTACALLSGHLDHVTTIDKLSRHETVDNIFKIPGMHIDTSKIRFISGNSLNLSCQDIGEGYDLIFIDGEHTAKAVKNDFKLALNCTTDDAVIIFDDFRNKHKGVKKYIQSLNYPKTIISSDGWIYKNIMIKKHKDADRVIDGKEYDSGQVVLMKKGRNE